MWRRVKGEVKDTVQKPDKGVQFPTDFFLVFSLSLAAAGLAGKESPGIGEKQAGSIYHPRAVTESGLEQERREKAVKADAMICGMCCADAG